MSKKGLYHSELAKMSPVTAKILSEPTESRFPDRPKWIAIEIDGEERFLNCENTGVELALAGLKGQWARLDAKGRGEDASIEINEVEGKPAPAKEEQKPRPAQEISLKDGDKIKSYAEHASRIFAVSWEESKKVMALIPAQDGEELTAAQWLDLRLRIAQGFAIEINKIIRKERF
jgi:hypothetical protein